MLSLFDKGDNNKGVKSEQDQLVELKEVRDNTWVIIRHYEKVSSGASIHLFVEKTYENLLYLIEKLLYGDKREAS